MYYVYSSLVYLSLSKYDVKRIKQNDKLFHNYVSFWMSKSHITPGLDFAGGADILLRVQFDQVFYDRMMIFKYCIKEHLLKKNIVTNMVILGSYNKSNIMLQIKFKFQDDINEFKNKILINFNNLEMSYFDKNTLILAFNKIYCKKIKNNIMDRMIEIIRNRIQNIGLIELYIARYGIDKIQIQIPGYYNSNRAKQILGRTAQLNFYICNDKDNFILNLHNLPNDVVIKNKPYKSPTGLIKNDIYLEFNSNQLSIVKYYLKDKCPSNLLIKYGASGLYVNKIRTYVLLKKDKLSGNKLLNANMFLNNNSQLSGVIIKFNSSGSKLFYKLTKKYIGKRLAIVLDNNVSSISLIKQSIKNGEALISLDASTLKYKNIKEEIKELVLLLKSGALPAKLTFEEEKIIGPSLGDESIIATKKAIIISFICISVFMLYIYRQVGIISIIGLCFNMCMIICILSYFNSTITLSSAAGLLLILGMSIDSHIIINERIKEELIKYTTFHIAVQRGHYMAFNSILDANITTFIIGVILFYFGVSIIKNFAIMILIGSSSSLISAMFINKLLFDMINNNNFLSKKFFNL